MRVAFMAMAVVLSLTGCGGDKPPSSSTDSAERSIESPIVGTWERVWTCEENVASLKEAGLGQFAAEHVRGNELVTGPINPKNLCQGAVPRKHGHFFTSDGTFGSTNHRGEQVDDGTFRLDDADTIVIGKVAFDFRVENDKLFLDPVMPDCVDTGCFEAQWAVAVASPGHPWNRVG